MRGKWGRGAREVVNEWIVGLCVGMCSRKVFDVRWAVSLSENFEFDFGVIFEGKCKALGGVRGEFQHARDW